MKCIITGIPTKNKWKGKTVCKAIIEVAKYRRGNSGGSLRDYVVRLQNSFRAARSSWLEDNKEITREEYVVKANEWLNAELGENK
ncbi:MAG: hypothetical protein Unbinned1322contig1000_20 [Prokaryotic dsDNA virus sp.]|nr:hypothetical protein [Aequorivita sp.]QDP57276.1 MAG: hypothetical protein Unbinned1322contig1000_20 [Prokaryotic dsDNA virus sp.]|tara:strand:+ start:6599 stop:6853 length:255 start_codon:yes stop_codon:yes gene_type:complete